ncbi:MAG: type II secretion system F family protein, partial [Novipirellula sp. JB048]
SSPFLPAGAAHMVATAEKTGKLGDVLKMVGEHFEDQGERQLRDVVKLLEPIVIVFLGVIVAGVAFSIILPLLDVSSMSQ